MPRARGATRSRRRGSGRTRPSDRPTSSSRRTPAPPEARAPPMPRRPSGTPRAAVQSAESDGTGTGRALEQEGAGAARESSAIRARTSERARPRCPHRTAHSWARRPERPPTTSTTSAKWRWWTVSPASGRPGSCSSTAVRRECRVSHRIRTGDYSSRRGFRRRERRGTRRARFQRLDDPHRLHDRRAGGRGGRRRERRHARAAPPLERMAARLALLRNPDPCVGHVIIGQRRETR